MCSRYNSFGSITKIKMTSLGGMYDGAVEDLYARLYDRILRLNQLIDRAVDPWMKRMLTIELDRTANLLGEVESIMMRGAGL
jgi:hypothetical protein